jgi:hypothetical protein
MGAGDEKKKEENGNYYFESLHPGCPLEGFAKVKRTL